MTRSKFSLADLLTVLGAAGFGFICFLSLNFLSLGETKTSIIGAVILAFLLGGLALGAKLLKKTGRNFKTCFIWEWILMLMFAIVALIAIKPFSHYFTVLEHKSEIQNKVTSNVEQASRIFAEYEKYANTRETLYKGRLNSVVAAKKVNPSEYSRFGFIYGTPDNTQVENKMFTLHAQLFPTNYEGADGIKQVATNWLANAKNTLESKWAFTFGLVEVVNNVHTNITAWKEKLTHFSTFRPQGDVETTLDFDYPLTFSNVTDDITELGKPTTLAIVSAISFYLLMMLSYFITDRHSRRPPFKVIFGTSGVGENEL